MVIPNPCICLCAKRKDECDCEATAGELLFANRYVMTTFAVVLIIIGLAMAIGATRL